MGFGNSSRYADGSKITDLKRPVLRSVRHPFPFDARNRDAVGLLTHRPYFFLEKGREVGEERKGKKRGRGHSGRAKLSACQRRLDTYLLLSTEHNLNDRRPSGTSRGKEGEEIGFTFRIVSKYSFFSTMLEWEIVCPKVVLLTESSS